MSKLTDESKMPFGKYIGHSMSDVPAGYFHYLWINGIKEKPQEDVHVYIKDNLEALMHEHPDAIWD